jgi:mRNA interferase MazF
MAIFAHPRPGTVLICNFDGFREPEMVKARPVVIVSPHYIERYGLYAVVPLSSSAPEPVRPYHYRFAESRVPGMPDAVWAKCDMVVSVAESRLDRVKVGRGVYKHGNISPEELDALRKCMKYALGLA